MRTGFAGLDHILKLQPELLKLEEALVEVIVIAERIETTLERLALTELGVPYGQGYHFARPDDVALSHDWER